MKQEPKDFFGTRSIKKEEPKKRREFNWGDKETIYNSKDSLVLKLQNKIKEIENRKSNVVQKKQPINTFTEKKEEPKKIEVVQIRKEEPKKELTFEERLILSRKQQMAKKTINQPLEKKEVEFLAVINGNQTVYEKNSMVTVRVLEDVNYGKNKVLPRNTYLYGVANFTDKGRINILFSSRTEDNKRIPINLTAYDQLDGYKGLLIDDEEVLSYLKEDTDNEINTEISRQGRIGEIISNVFKKKQRAIKVDLYDEHTIILKGTL